MDLILSLIGLSTSAGGGRAASDSNDSSGSAEQSSPVRNYENITVDEQGNRVIFFGTQAEYDDFVALARQLDTPVPEVMIEVTIAEVTLTDNSSYGLDIIFDSDIAPRFRADLSSSGGFSGTVETGQVTLEGSADSGSNQINVLSTPRIVARSGTEATVQVGTDVRLAGVKIGTVTGIELNPKTFRAVTSFSIANGIEIPDDSAVLVSSEGLLGGNFIEISPGGSPMNYAAGAEIEDTQGAVSLISLLLKFVGGSGGSSSE